MMLKPMMLHIRLVLFPFLAYFMAVFLVKETIAVPISKPNNICEIFSRETKMLKNSTIIYSSTTNTLTSSFPLKDPFLFTLEHYICPRNDNRKPATQKCLMKHPLKMTHITYTTPALIGIAILPSDMDCSHCVVQWIIKPVNFTSGMSPKRYAVCLNISAEPHSKHRRPDIDLPAGSGNEISTTKKNMTCTGNGDYTKLVGIDKLCTKHCSNGNCPQKYCKCNKLLEIKMEYPCKGAPMYKLVPGMGEWCDINCQRGFCPYSHCDCSGRTDPPTTTGPTTTTTTAPTTTPTTTPTTPTTTPTTTPGTTTSEPTTTPAPICDPVDTYEIVPGMKMWCEVNCKAGFCPESHCTCRPGGPTPTDGGTSTPAVTIP